MDLTAFRRVVDRSPPGITGCRGDLTALYHYVGLPVESALSVKAVSDALYRKIRAAFASGHQSVWRRCRDIEIELIQRHVIDGDPLDPYFAVLEHMKDAVRAQGSPTEEIRGDWESAIRHAYDHMRHSDWGTPTIRERTHARAFEVARAAKRLQDLGYASIRSGAKLSLTPDADAKLVAAIERLIAGIGGLNVARRIFQRILPAYDPGQERYHLIHQASPTGGGKPQTPYGYLFLLTAKHAFRKTRGQDTDKNWLQLCGLVTDYAAVLDVQEYLPNIWIHMDAAALLRYLQELALYDTLFCIPQVRGSDVVKLMRGALDGLDFDRKYGRGWSINDALTVTAAVLERSRGRHGPLSFTAHDLRSSCGGLAPETLHAVLDDVLTHPRRGANQRFSRPSDAPARGVPGLEEAGHDFFLRPLLQHQGKSAFLLDRSACAPAFLEALLAPLRSAHRNFDDAQVGPAIERFLRAELAAHAIPTLTGTYCAGGQEGECDLVVETTQTIIFLEIKKKSLTRRARAGSDAHVLLDLANSFLKAQVQAGWHEVLLRRHGYLDLHAGAITRLEHKGRAIERIAVSFLDFGSFQDRVLAKQFLEGTLNAAFSVSDPSLKKDFDEINASLAALRQQIQALYPGQATVNQPFFHCWFLSVPQMLILLDGATGPEMLRTELWRTRHIVTGSSDFYYDHARMLKLAGSAATTA